MFTSILKKSTHFILIVNLLIFGMISNSYSRQATVEDTDISIEVNNRDIEVHQNGTFTETIEISAKALKDSGKDKLVSVPLTYNSRNTKLKIIEAKTIKEDKVYPVDLKNIEDKPLASSPQGFDQNNQILIAFPEMSVNAQIYLKYQMINTEAPVPGFFATDFVYGLGQYCKAGHTKVASDIPFFVKVNDPEQYLEVKQFQKNNKHYMDITLKRPIMKAAIDEMFMVTDNKAYPWVTMSTLNEWSKLGERMVKRYDDIVNQPLPELYQNIVKEAEKKQSTIEKINVVTARLSENITYMGDWRTVKGAFVPRNLAEIVKSKLGDCKDMSASTVAILKKLGLKADVAIIYRGVEFNDTPNDLPNMFDFNHAFVRVVEGSEMYWIDPTNFTSFAQGIYPDIADRKTLVLDPVGPHLAKTPALNEKSSQVSLLKKIFLPKTDPDLAHVEGQVTLTGVHALPLVGADLRSSKESINYDIIRAITDETRTIGWKIGNYNLTSRIAEDLNFKFNFTEKHTKINTTAGDAFIVRTQNLINKLLIKTQDRTTGLQLDIPSIYRHETLISKASLVGKISNCSVDSPWVQGSRQVMDTADGIKITDELIVKKDKILHQELKTAEYLALQNKVHACFGETALVYQNQ